MFWDFGSRKEERRQWGPRDSNTKSDITEIVIDLDEVTGKVPKSPTKVRDEVIRDIKIV